MMKHFATKVRKWWNISRQKCVNDENLAESPKKFGGSQGMERYKTRWVSESLTLWTNFTDLFNFIFLVLVCTLLIRISKYIHVFVRNWSTFRLNPQLAIFQIGYITLHCFNLKTLDKDHFQISADKVNGYQGHQHLTTLVSLSNNSSRFVYF